MKEDMKVEEMKVSTQSKIHSGEKLYPCEMCGKLFSTSGNRNIHMKTHTGEKPFSCEMCNKSFSNSSDKNKHLRTHTGEKPYLCELCGKSFATSSEKSVHMRNHTGDKPHSCEICDKKFKTKGYKDSHMKTHSSEKPYLCQIKFCAKSFAQEADLDIHMRRHNGEKPFNCDICSKSFSYSIKRDKHMRSHTGEKPFSCEVCGKSFSTSCHKVRHMRIHTGGKPYTCDLCSQTFSSFLERKKHMKTHLEIKQCNKCDKSSKQSSDIIATKMKTDISEKPYSCDTCGKLFSTSTTSNKDKLKKVIPELTPTLKPVPDDAMKLFPPKSEVNTEDRVDTIGDEVSSKDPLKVQIVKACKIECVKEETKGNTKPENLITTEIKNHINKEDIITKEECIENAPFFVKVELDISDRASFVTCKTEEIEDGETYFEHI